MRLRNILKQIDKVGTQLKRIGGYIVNMKFRTFLLGLSVLFVAF